MNYLSRIVVLVSLVAVLASGCANNAPATDKGQAAVSAGKKSITDMAGKKVDIPANIQKVGDAWPAHNEVLCMLGFGSKIVATIHTPGDRPWLYKVNQDMKNAATVFTKSDVIMEELLKNKPDLVFLPTSYTFGDKIVNAGIPVVYLNFTNFEEMKACFKLSGEILGPEAMQRAEKYIAYLDGKLKAVQEVTAKIPAEEKPKVLHINSLSPLVVDGIDTIIDAWISAAGGKNAAAEVSGNMKKVSMEQVLQWNPDVIIFQADITNADEVLQSDAWKKIAAVQNGKVFRNPDGAFLWDRYGAEEALQIQWAAKTLHPDKFTAVDMEKESINFYKEFLGYSLSAEEVGLILSGKPPVKAQ